MKRLLLLTSFALSFFIVNAQGEINVGRVNVRDGINLKSKWIRNFITDTAQLLILDSLQSAMSAKATFDLIKGYNQLITLPKIKRVGNGIYTEVEGDSVKLKLGGFVQPYVAFYGTGSEIMTFGVDGPLARFDVETNTSASLQSIGILGGNLRISSLTLMPSGATLSLDALGIGFDYLGNTSLNIGNDGTGDLYYRGADGYLKRLPASVNGKVLKIISGIPGWGDDNIGGTSAWGSLTGSISSQTDLQAALNNKQNASAALSAIGAVVANGGLYRTGTDSYAARTLTGTANKITITNADGISGNPTINVGSDITQNAEAQTLTNKSVNGDNNTLTNVGTMTYAQNFGYGVINLSTQKGSGAIVPVASNIAAGLLHPLDKQRLDSMKNNQIADSSYWAKVTGTGNYDTVKLYLKSYGATAYTGYNQFLISKYQVTDLIQPGTNMTRDGNGTVESPYVFNSTASGGSSDINVGTTAVNSGTPGNIIYNNAGVVGELASTGTGDVARKNSPVFTGNPEVPTQAYGVGNTRAANTLWTRNTIEQYSVFHSTNAPANSILSLNGTAFKNIIPAQNLSVNITTITDPGAPAYSNTVMIAFSDNGTVRSISGWPSNFRTGDIPLPTSTVLGKIIWCQFIYNIIDNKWDLVGLTQINK